MKKLTIVLSIFAIAVLSSCGTRTGEMANYDAEDMEYYKDDRVNLCFGVIASKKSGSMITSGMGVTCVPCKNVEHLLGK